MKNLALQHPPFKLHVKLQIICFLYDKTKNETRCKEIMENIKVDKNYLSKILSALVIEGLIKKNPVVRRINQSDSYFTIILTKKGIRYARRMIKQCRITQEI